MAYWRNQWRSIADAARANAVSASAAKMSSGFLSKNTHKKVLTAILLLNYYYDDNDHHHHHHHNNKNYYYYFCH